MVRGQAGLSRGSRPLARRPHPASSGSQSLRFGRIGVGAQRQRLGKRCRGLVSGDSVAALRNPAASLARERECPPKFRLAEPVDLSLPGAGPLAPSISVDYRAFSDAF